METLLLLNTYFAELSRRYGFKIRFEFDQSDIEFSAEDSRILSEIKKSLTDFTNENQEKPKKDANICNFCQKQFSHESILEYHKTQIHSNPTASELTEQEFSICLQCQKCFKTHSEFQAHECDMKLKLPQNMESLQSKFKCGICHETFKTVSRIKFHFEQCCDNQEKHCDKCDNFKTKSHLSLQIHRKEVHKESLNCQLCPKTFKLKTSLVKHLISSHEKRNVSFQCDKCPKKFIKKVYLTNHLLRFHHLRKENLCVHCGEAFLTSESLKKHTQEHFSNLTFKCDTCQKVFKRKDKWKNHLAIHSGIKPHQCQICPKKFITKTKLNEHLRRHNGEKRFSCLLCSKVYSGSYDLRKHMKKIHVKVGKNIQPNVPLTPQIIAYIEKK